MAQLDAKLLGAELGTLVREHVNRVIKRVEDLERQVQGMQSKMDGTKALSFCGAWQAALSYPAGAVVRHGDSTYTAIRDVAAGKAEPTSRGSGWVRVV